LTPHFFIAPRFARVRDSNLWLPLGSGTPRSVALGALGFVFFGWLSDHIGNGVFGGGVPFIGASIVAATGIALSGLFYPMAIAAIGVIVSLTAMREPTHKTKIWDEVGGGALPLVPDQP
jgi:hypothetical protein